jgi:DNA primase small subunit
VGGMNLSDYYITAPLHEMPDFDKREFGVKMKCLISQDNPNGTWRHLAFKNVNLLRAFLIERKPDHVYFSSAKYKEPWLKPMESKKEGWLGSDLVFDIDNDHLATPSLESAAYNAVKLYDFLKSDFGFKDMIITFSGSRGYHIHVRDKCVQTLDNHMRAQVMECFGEYIKLSNGKRKYNRRYVGLDTMVTPDITRLIRLPGSIHGKTMQECRIIKIGRD